MKMGCGHTTSRDVPVKQVRIQPEVAKIVSLPSIQIVVGKPGRYEEKEEALPPTQTGTPESDYQKTVFLVKSGDIQYRVPRLLNPEAASTIIRRRRLQVFDAAIRINAKDL